MKYFGTHGAPWWYELSRRGVLHVAGLYVLASWVLVQVADLASTPFPLPDEAIRLIWIAACLGFPIALVFGWRYDITRDGVVRTDPHRPDTTTRLSRADHAIITVLTLLALGIAATTAHTLIWMVEQQRVEVPGLPPAPVVVPESIAVLPFADLSPNGDQEYLSDGLAEELLNMLARIPELSVAARTSSFAFREQAMEITEIARRLRVAHVLEGSVRRQDNRIRVTAQLIHASDGYQLWSQIYDRRIDDIFAIQDEIAAEVVSQLKMELLGGPPTTRQTDPDAYALFLQARHVSHRVTPETYEQAVTLYLRALDIDPEYAAAWTGLARMYCKQVEKGLLTDEEGRALAFDAVNRALELDPYSAQAHADLAWIAMYLKRDLGEAAEYFERAMYLAPTDPEILFDSATLLQALGRMDEAIALKEFSVARDPVNPRRHYNLGNAYLFGRRYESAVSAYRTALTLSPTLLGAHYHIGRALLLSGRPGEALEAMEKESFEAWRLVGLPTVYHALGRSEEASATIALLIDKYQKDAAYNIAYDFALLEQPDLAFEWLHRAVEYGDPGLSEIAVTPEFMVLEDDPRWIPFLEQLGKSPSQLRAVKFNVEAPK